MEDSDLIFNEDLIRSKLLKCDDPERLSLKDPYFTPSAILFTIIPHEERPFDLVIIHRTNRGTRHRGEMSFPGGQVDPTDTSRIHTALRECEEEIGVKKENIHLLGCLNDFPTMTKYVITPVIGYISKNERLVRQEREVREILKIPITFFVNKRSFREQPIDIGSRKFPIFYFNYKANGKKYTIWGATAFMIANFIHTVYGLNISNLKINRFTLDQIKPLKNYIEMRNNILSKNK